MYLSIGNIDKDTRRQTSSHATVLLGYIPTSKLTCFSDNTRSLAGYRLFHYCMRQILDPLIAAGTDGIEMVCADGWVRSVHPILAAYIADHPERCLVASCKENRCPQCTIPTCKLGDPLDSILYREPYRTVKILQHKATGRRVKAFKDEGLRAVNAPFWSDLPFTNIFTCLTPDLLHQLHKGIFKDHLVSWCQAIAGKEEIDRRFNSMTSHSNLRHFRDGISLVSQWTGHEFKEMEKVFVGLLSGAVQPRVLQAARSVLDFIYYSQLPVQSTQSLNALRTSLNEFHDNKQIFLDLGVRDDFNFPKLHAMQHYIDVIKSRGSPDQFNTELPERLHIDFAKDAYRATNKHNYIRQMTKWLERQELVHAFSLYLIWASDKILPLSQAPSIDCLPQVVFKCPSLPSETHVTIDRIVSEFTATEFRGALVDYLQFEARKLQGIQAILPNALDTFSIYHHIHLLYPKIHGIRLEGGVTRVRATRKIKKDNSLEATRQTFDTILVRVDESNPHIAGTQLEGKYKVIIQSKD